MLNQREFVDRAHFFPSLLKCLEISRPALPGALEQK